MSEQSWIGLKLRALDVLFFRDGRPFDAANRVEGGLPNPQTLAGAMRTALLGQHGFRGAQFREFSQRMRNGEEPRDAVEAIDKDAGWVAETTFRGPWIGLDLGDRVEPLLPQPISLAKKKDANDYLRATPLASNELLPGWDGPRLPMWWPGTPDNKAKPGFLTLTDLRTFLKGETVAPGIAYQADDLYGFDNRVGIEVGRDSYVSADGQIYGIRFLVLKSKVKRRDNQGLAKVCLYAEMQPAAGVPENLELPDSVPLGGEGRYVKVEQVAPCDWPTPKADNPTSMLYLATPAFFGVGRETPEFTNGADVKAAMSGSPLAVSGWDIAANGPRPTRFAVPAGSVYFVEGSVTHESLTKDTNEAREGWGFTLQGTW